MVRMLTMMGMLGVSGASYYIPVEAHPCDDTGKTAGQNNWYFEELFPRNTTGRLIGPGGLCAHYKAKDESSHGDLVLHNCSGGSDEVRRECKNRAAARSILRSVLRGSPPALFAAGRLGR